MNRWAIVAGAVAAVGAAVVVASLVARRSRQGADSEIPGILEDCFDRIRRIEEQLHRLHPEAA